MPEKKLRYAGIGCQHQGWADISRIVTHPAVEPVAFCDIDKRHFVHVDKRWPDLPKFSDFRKLFKQM